MGISRREFLKAGGACALGLGVLPLGNALAENKPKYSPNTKALKAKNWGIVIDTTKLENNLESIIKACHKIHNVPDIGNEKEEVKWIWKDKFEHVFPDRKHEFLDEETKKKDFLVLCNHCENPACVRVCPTKATFKSKDGIVMMDFHRCIGCRYCMAACPYGARSFNFKDPRSYIEKINPEYPTRTRGVVEKCNLCAERLAVGLMPACVEASNGAIIVGDLDDPNSEVRKILASKRTIQRKVSAGTMPKVYYIV